MKHTLNTVLSVLFLMSVCVPGTQAAQIFVPSPVEISKEKINISGTVFYMHTVLQGQTLYSISKAYEISQDELKKNNPSLSEGLKTGTILYIPVKSQQKEDEENQVAEKEPENTEADAAAGASVTAAAATTAAAVEAVTEPITGNVKFKTYTVKWYETLYDVAKKFDVSVGDLAELNGMTPNSVLGKRQKLRIPDKDYAARNAKDASARNDSRTYPGAATAAGTAAAATVATTTSAFASSITADTVLPIQQPEPASIYEKEASHCIALILPFGANNPDKADVNYIDFYSGAMMAMNDLKTKDRAFSKYSLKVIDLKAYPSTDKMLSSGIVDGCDLIIGPVQPKDVSKMAEYGKENKILTVSPLDVKTADQITGNPYFFLFPVTSDILLSNTGEKISGHDDACISVIYEKGTEKFPALMKVKEVLATKGTEYNEFSYGVLEGRNVSGKINNTLLDHTRPNVVYIASENEAFVSEALRNLHLIKNSDPNLDISVYGLSKWRNFESVELEYLHNLNTSICLGYNVDYNDSTSLGFTTRYETVFHMTPTPYAFQGYDILSYFLTEFEENGIAFPDALGSEAKPMIQSDINFRQDDKSSGFKNTGIRFVTYRPGWLIECRK